MKNSWKQLGGWGTELEDRLKVKGSDLFVVTKFRLTALYFIVGLLILLPSALIHDALIADAIRYNLGELIGDAEIANSISLVIIDNINGLSWTIRLGITIALGIVAYLLAIVTLHPIQRAFEEQRRFIANASHELRTPLAIMKTSAEVSLINKRGLDREDFVKITRDNLEEMNRMTDTLQLLLTFSGYQSSTTKPLFTNFHICNVVEKAIQLVGPMAEARRIKINFEGDIPSLVRGNKVALEEMTINLLKNAVFYTPHGGKIDILIKRSGGNVSLIVKDTGIGIAAEDLPYIFEPFYRGINSSLMHPGKGSSGLGLALVREIVKLHRARIEVKSEPQRGTAFSVMFRGVKG